MLCNLCGWLARAILAYSSKTFWIHNSSASVVIEIVMGIYSGGRAALECRRLDAAFPGGGAAIPPHSKDAAHRYKETQVFKLTRMGGGAWPAVRDAGTGDGHQGRQGLKGRGNGTKTRGRTPRPRPWRPLSPWCPCSSPFVPCEVGTLKSNPDPVSRGGAEFAAGKNPWEFPAPLCFMCMCRRKALFLLCKPPGHFETGDAAGWYAQCNDRATGDCGFRDMADLDRFTWCRLIFQATLQNE